MEIVDFIALTIVALVIFMIVYKFYFKKTQRNIRSVNSKSVSASSPQQIPEDGSPRHHECISTYSMDIQINDFNPAKEKHIFSALSDAKFSVSSNSRLTLELGEKTNELIITSTYLDSVQIIPNIPLQEWVNISVVFNSDILEVFINGQLSQTYILNGYVRGEDIYMYTTQMGGFEGYIRNIQYIPDSLSTREIRNLMGQSDSGAGSVYNTVNKALNTIIELPGKYLYNYDNGSCA